MTWPAVSNSLARYSSRPLRAVKNHTGACELSSNLVREGINPDIPWLYNLEIDFGFQ